MRLLSAFCCLFLLFSCENQKNKIIEPKVKNNVVDVPIIIKQQQPKKVEERIQITDSLIKEMISDDTVYLNLPKDTIINDISVLFYNITEEYFYKLIKNKYVDNSPFELERENFIQKKDSCYIISLKNLKKDTLCDVTYLHAETDHREWKFKKYWKEYDLIAYTSFFYEANGYLIKSLSNGQEYWTFQIPQKSPSKNRFVASSIDYVHEANGIQFFEYQNDSINLNLEFVFDTWGPTDTFWYDDDHILFIRTQWDIHDQDLWNETKEQVKSIKDEYTLMKIIERE
ncbi:hypothetical protein GTQ40_07655 [Flavobacteriaceae bacterium R38]|nr:hypothetical protein [Flavobacteriaceae bacterium R38]